MLLPLVAQLLPFVQQDAPVEPRAIEAAVRALGDRLRTGPGPVRIIVFGDSLAAGWGPEDPATEAYSAVFAQALQARYPNCSVEVIAAGGPGDPSDVGLVRLHPEVLSRRPDVVIIQFGGNDERLGRPPRNLEDDLVTMVRRIRAALPNTLCIIVAPPMNDPMAGTPYVRAAVLAAQTVGVPVADFDGAIRAADRDFRGPFCWGSHPGAYSHLVMGRELLRAWSALLGRPNCLSVTIEGYSRLVPRAENLPLNIHLRNSSDADLQVDLEYGPALLAHRTQLALRPHDTETVTTTVDVPQLAVSSRTRSYKIWSLASAVDAEASDLDAKRLSVAPVVVPDVASGLQDPPTLTWHTFQPASLVRGEGSWRGDDDLSARFAVTLSSQRLTFIVEVTDDDLTTAKPPKHISDGDSVEVALDLRPQADQGKPVYSPDVVLLLVKPGATTFQRAVWEPLDEMTPRLQNVEADSFLTKKGYAVRLSLPVGALERGNREGLAGIGFDVHVNDADFGLDRERQMVWAGTRNNFIDPSAFAALAEPGDTPPRFRVSLR